MLTSAMILYMHAAAVLVPLAGPSPLPGLFMDCQAMEMDQLVALAQRRYAWNAHTHIVVKQLR